AGLRLFAADRVHQAANQNGEQDDAHAVTRNDEMQLVKEPVHQVGEEDEDLRPDPKIARVGKRVEMKPVDIAAHYFGGHTFAIRLGGRVTQELDLHRPIVEQVFLRQ